MSQSFLNMNFKDPVILYSASQFDLESMAFNALISTEILSVFCSM